MSDLDEFRPRIRNWARVYRDRFVRHESNLMVLIRALKRETPAEFEAPRVAVDYRDADFIDECLTSLRQFNAEFDLLFPVLKSAYLTRYSAETFETTEDERDATRHRAKYARVYPWRFNEDLEKAEQMLMNYAVRREETEDLQFNQK